MASGTEDTGGVEPAVNQVTERDAGQVVELISLAFLEDPVWSWAFPDSDRRLEHFRGFWGLLLHSAVPYGRVWMREDGGAAAVWIPPGKPEMTEEDEAKVEPMLREMIGAHTDDVLVLMERFEDNHPRHTPHFYLSLLGTHPDHRGQGKGMALLAANLDEIDELGMPAYLESSNPVNHGRYEKLGFEHVGEFSGPRGEPTVACMWREARGKVNPS